MISVICTAYNTEKYMNRCIDSVLAQTYSNFEFVLIDDGSTDTTGAIIDEYASKDNRIKAIHQENKGHSEGRNVGVANSTGEYIFFIDSDDYIHPQTLEVLLENLIVYNASISVGGLSRNGEIPEKLENSCKVFSSMQALHLIVDAVKTNYMNRLFLPMCATWNKIFKRSLFDKVKFPTGRVHDDNATVHRFLYAAETIVLTTGVTYSYTRRRNGIVAKGLYDADMVAAYQDRIDFFKEVGLEELLPLTYRRYNAIVQHIYDTTKDPEWLQKLKDPDNTSKPQDYIIENINDLKPIGLFHASLDFYNGVTSWIYNFVLGLKDKYYITLYVNHISSKIKEKFRGIVSIVQLTGQNTYHCDVLINDCVNYPIPECLTYDKMYTMIHCDYARFRDREDRGIKPGQNYIAVSETAAMGLNNFYRVPCNCVEGLFIKEKPKAQQILHLVSATRFTNQKGFDKFAKLAMLLKSNGILFEWRIYCDSNLGFNAESIPCPEMIKLPALDNEVLMSYLADADYVVQLSDSEGFGMIVHESLMMGTPVIVSDIPVFTKYVQNGYNGYIIPHNLEEFNVKQLLYVPKNFSYDLSYDELVSKWQNILDN